MVARKTDAVVQKGSTDGPKFGLHHSWLDKVELDLPNAELLRTAEERQWSFGDVEANGVYYHPRFLHYAHQAFEIWFEKRFGLSYADLSRAEPDARARRMEKLGNEAASPFTLAPGALYAELYSPMRASDRYRLWPTMQRIGERRVVVVVLLFGISPLAPAGYVAWLRWARLVGKPGTIAMPSAFGRAP